MLDLRVVFWVTRDAYRSLTEQAWDLRQIMLTVVVNAHLGRLTRAQLDAERGVELTRRGGGELEQAAALGPLVFVLNMKGEPDEALRVLLEQVVPLYERAGDRGELGEALRIWRDEVLPIHEREGDVGAQAAAFGEIASIHELRGELDEALRVRLDHELPLYEQSRDLRRRLWTLTEVAALRVKLGELDAAIELLEQQVLPEVERLGVSNFEEELRALAEQIRAQLAE